MRSHVKEANKVLLVFTKTYQRRFEGDEEEGKGLGATFEGAIATQSLYESGGRNRKFRPVVLREKTRNSSRLSFACSTAIASIPLSIRSSPLTTAKSQAATRRINSQLTSIAYAIMRDSTRSGDMPVHGAESEVEEPWSAEQYATRSKAAHDKAQPIRED
jgi:hypothetical protein